MKIQKKCNICGKLHVLDVKEESYKLYLSGVHIQDALPELSVDDRELLISGICGTCFDAIFSSDDEDEDNE